MTLFPLLDTLFPAGHEATVTQQVVTGTALTASGPVALLGTVDAAAISHAIALRLAGQVLHLVEHHPGRPLVLLVDTQGQALSRAQELLCLNGSLAHLARCIDLARRRGHVSLSLITGEAVSGGFLSFGLMADRVYALQSAQVRVMDLKAMARVTKIPHERLVALAASSPTFAPGAENYHRMGAIEALWDTPSSELLEQALAQLRTEPSAGDSRLQQGRMRGGRQEAAAIVAAVLTA